MLYSTDEESPSESKHILEVKQQSSEQAAFIANENTKHTLPILITDNEHRGCCDS